MVHGRAAGELHAGRQRGGSTCSPADRQRCTGASCAGCTPSTSTVRRPPDPRHRTSDPRASRAARAYPLRRLQASGPRLSQSGTYNKYDSSFSFHLFKSILYNMYCHQTDCSFMENVVSLWLTLNGCPWGSSSSAPPAGWSLSTYSVPSDGPKIRLAADTVHAILASLVQ